MAEIVHDVLARQNPVGDDELGEKAVEVARHRTLRKAAAEG
jgi:hypothetical protein